MKLLTPLRHLHYHNDLKRSIPPKKASWLNMAEIELSALSKQCLDRRIDKMSILAKEVMAWSKKRNRLETKITWQFTKSKARDKLNRGG